MAAEILRLAGCQIPIVQVPSHSLTRVHNIEVNSMLPSGFMHADLLQELVNRHEVVALLRQRFPGMRILVPGECSFPEQVQSMARARVVIAPQGAHAANLLWAPPWSSASRSATTAMASWRQWLQRWEPPCGAARG